MMQSEAAPSEAARTEPAGHPELALERERLRVTLAAMQRAVDEPLKIGAGGDFAATMYLEEHRAWRRIQLREALDSPYFARIDFLPEDRTAPETYYIGKTYFEGDRPRGAPGAVTGWQAPVAALFYRSTAARAAYQAPEGEIRGALRLKRRLVIDHATLAHVADDLDERHAHSPDGPPEDGATHRRAITAPLGEAPSGVAPSGVAPSGVAPSGVAPSGEAAAGDDFLRAILSQGASPWLRDIIATIQAPQYALIAAPANQVLVVQGVAGSGKTSIALHRLSYLIYPTLLTGKLPPHCIVFGPNRLFLKYVSAVLPKLGLQKVVQTTVADWALERMNLTHLRATDATFEALLSPDVPPAQKETLYHRSRLKTSRRMGTLMERYVEWRRGQIEIPEEGWLVRQTVQQHATPVRVERRIPAEALRVRHARGAERPFAVHRAAFLESVLTLAISTYETNAYAEAEAQMALGKKRLQQAAEMRAEVQRLRASGGQGQGSVAFGAAPVFGAPSRSRPVPSTAGGSTALVRQTIRQLEMTAERRQREGESLIAAAEAMRAAALSPEQQEQARKGARAELERLVDTYWPAINPLRDYYALLNDEALLHRLAEGLFDAGEVALLHGAPARSSGTVDLSDLPAVHYLFVLSQGPEAVGRVGHEYVVVDEAQDVAELDLHCLRRLEHRHSFTLLGDLSQSIYSHRGLTSWEQAEAVFSGEPHSYEECPVSYRTTAEITAVANRVLRSMAALAASGAARRRPRGAARRLANEAQAFDRHGPPPTLHGAATEDDLVAALARTLAGVRAKPYGSVAIIAKTAERAAALVERLAGSRADRVRVGALAQSGVADVALITTPDFEYRGGVIALPVSLAKGLEFDAAIVVDADAHTYAGTAFDARLLYVALTRAMHELHVLWTGERSPHLHEWSVAVGQRSDAPGSRGEGS